jgi:NAD(P)-dependent dehydrogenase (short-subunit alcohol dehydrogenase family)
MNLINKVVVVSGSSSGIGKSTSELLIEYGASVIGLDVAESVSVHERYEHYNLDITKEQDIIKIINEVDAVYGRIDGLVNCAGVYSNSKPFYDLSLEEWNRVISTNVTGIFLLAKHVAGKMIRNKTGKIINISCIRSGIFRPEMADYAASKGGVTALTAAMALDLKDYNIQVNAVAPGFTYTGMTAKSFDKPQIREFSESIIPMGRIANPRDIANVVLFLLSDLASYINGETIFVDGGFKISK